ncbi:MAG: hypothetical protein Q4D17_12040 [Planctomycetia bacterium]|nr:hypothetical protein [Planctomycetia bacterium]
MIRIYRTRSSPTVTYSKLQWREGFVRFAELEVELADLAFRMNRFLCFVRAAQC